MARKANKFKDFIEKHFSENVNAPIEELASFAKLYCVKPDVGKLIDQYYRNMANRQVRKVKNDSGSRRLYADRQNDIYSDVAQETSLEVLGNIRKDSQLKLYGNDKLYKTVTGRMAELSGQTILEFEHSEANVETADGL